MLGASAAGCGSAPPNPTIAHRVRLGETFRYLCEEYGTAVDLAQGTASPRRSFRWEIMLRVRDIAPGRFITLDLIIERVVVTVEGDRPLHFDSKDPATFDAARRHGDGIVPFLLAGRPIHVHMMPEGGILKVESPEAMRAAAAPGGAPEEIVRRALESTARLVVQPYTFVRPLRAGDQWSDLAPRAGSLSIPGEGETRFVGFERAGGRRCARFETAVAAPPVIRGLLVRDWKAEATTWVDLETGMIVDARFRWRAEAGYRADLMRSGDWRGRIRLTG